MLCKDCETIIPKSLMGIYELCGPCMFKRGYCKNFYSCGRSYNHAIRVAYGSWLCNECYRIFSTPLFTTEIAQDTISRLCIMDFITEQMMEDFKEEWGKTKAGKNKIIKKAGS